MENKTEAQMYEAKLEQAKANTEIIGFIAKQWGSVKEWCKSRYNEGYAPERNEANLIAMGMDPETAQLIVSAFYTEIAKEIIAAAENE